MNNEQLPLAMSESFWANSQFSIARYTGRIRVGKYDYVICNKDGKDIFECSIEAEKAGRDGFLHFCKANPDCWTLKQAKERLKQWQQKPND